MLNKKFRTLLIIFLLPLLLETVSAAEVSDLDPYSEGKLSLARCIEKGNFEFGLFLDALIYNDNLKEGIVEPFNDIIKRNQCQASDISGLIKQQDKMRKAIRDAFMTCNTQQLPKLKNAYHRTTAEIYYVRHIVDSGIVAALPFDIINTQEFSDTATKDVSAKGRSELYSAMEQNYVKSGMIEQGEFDLLFAKFESKYKDRKKTYLNCEKGSWQAVGDKWEEFKKFFTEDKAGLDEAGKSLGANLEKTKKEFKTIKTVELFTTDESFSDYLGSFGQMNLNNLEPEQGIGEISEALSENNPLGGTPTQGSIADTLSSSNRLYAIKKLEAEMSANFTTLYGNASDESIGLFLNTLDGRQVPEEGLIEILEQSFGPINQILKGAKVMNDRQCPGN